MDGPIRVGLQLRAKLRDEVVDRAGLTSLAEAPHAQQQLLARKHHASPLETGRHPS